MANIYTCWSPLLFDRKKDSSLSNIFVMESPSGYPAERLVTGIGCYSSIVWGCMYLLGLYSTAWYCVLWVCSLAIYIFLLLVAADIWGRYAYNGHLGDAAEVRGTSSCVSGAGIDTGTWASGSFPPVLHWLYCSSCCGQTLVCHCMHSGQSGAFQLALFLRL